MWSVRPDIWNVYLGTTQVAAFGPDGTTRAIATSSVEHGMNAGLDLIAKSRRRRFDPRVSFWLSGGLARPFVLQPLAGLGNWAEAQAYAVAKCPDATGIERPAPPFLDGWPSEDCALAVAVEQSMMSAISALAVTHKVRLTSVSPWWALALSRSAVARRSAEIFAADEGDVLTVLAAEQGRWRSAVTLSPRPDETLRHALYTRLSAAYGASEEAPIVATWTGRAATAEWPCMDASRADSRA